WDVSSGDPTFAQSARAIEHQVLANVQPGSIVLFHANGRGWHTEGALPGIIAALKARGYEFATVSELLAAGGPVVAATCYDSRPGDTDRPRHPLPVAAVHSASAGCGRVQRRLGRPRPAPGDGGLVAAAAFGSDPSK